MLGHPLPQDQAPTVESWMSLLHRDAASCRYALSLSLFLLLFPNRLQLISYNGMLQFAGHTTIVQIGLALSSDMMLCYCRTWLSAVVSRIHLTKPATAPSICAHDET